MQIEALPAVYKEIQCAQGTGTALCGPWCDKQVYYLDIFSLGLTV